MVSQYFVKNYTGETFKLLGRSHLVALGILGLTILLLIVLRKAENKRINTIFRYGLAVVLITQEISYHIWNGYIGDWSIQKMLPLHLCSVFVWLSAVMLITKNRTIYGFAYFLGISGALQALATPDAAQFGFPHYRFFQIFLSHSSIVLAALYMTIVEQYRPDWRTFKNTLIGLNIYGIIVFLINLAIGSNYLYINHKPVTASLFDILGPWPVYVIAGEAIALVMFLLLYSPYIIMDLRQKTGD